MEVEEWERSKNLRRVVVREVWRGQKREEYGLEDFLGNGLHDTRLFWDFGMWKMRVVGGIEREVGACLILELTA